MVSNLTLSRHLHDLYTAVVVYSLSWIVMRYNSYGYNLHQRWSELVGTAMTLIVTLCLWMSNFKSIPLHCAHMDVVGRTHKISAYNHVGVLLAGQWFILHSTMPYRTAVLLFNPLPFTVLMFLACVSNSYKVGPWVQPDQLA